MYLENCMPQVMRSIEIHASPSAVWLWLATQEALRRWISSNIEIDQRHCAGTGAREKPDPVLARGGQRLGSSGTVSHQACSYCCWHAGDPHSRWIRGHRSFRLA